MKESAKLGLILMLIACISGAVLAVSNNATKDIIRQQEIEATNKALREIFGNGAESEDLSAEAMKAIVEKYPDTLEVFKVKKDGNPVGFAVKNTCRGFGGPITLFTGFTDDGKVQGVNILKASETPGIGTRCYERDFLDRFNGVDASKEVHVEAISGASRTSNYVMGGVNYARDIYENILKKDGE